MSKIFTLLLPVFILSVTASAQIRKGSVLLGGQIYYNNYNTDHSTGWDDQKGKNANFEISVGKAIKENRVIGVNVGYSPNSSEYDYNGTDFLNSKNNFYNAGLFYRHYRKLARDFYFFADINAGYVGSKRTVEEISGTKVSTIKSAGGQVALAPGISYQLFRKFHLELLIPNIVSSQYSVEKTTEQQIITTRKSFSFSSSLKASGLNALAVGFRFII